MSVSVCGVVKESERFLLPLPPLAPPHTAAARAHEQGGACRESARLPVRVIVQWERELVGWFCTIIVKKGGGEGDPLQQPGTIRDVGGTPTDPWGHPWHSRTLFSRLSHRT